jgi:hypothetical protein
LVIAAAMTGHSKDDYDTHYAKPFRDAEERDRALSADQPIRVGTSLFTNWC